jgi:tetratricopeptide (TPR) repeat protein
MKTNNPFKFSKVALAVVGLGLSTMTLANTAAEPKILEAGQIKMAHADDAVKNKTKKAEDFIPDPAKRLTLENFSKGLAKLHGYLKGAVEKAKDEDKKFLVKEKHEIERQMANPKAAYDQLFASIEANSKRLAALNVFPPVLVAQMRKHYLETEAVKAMAAMKNQAKKDGTTDAYRAEMEYQLGIIARRDQVNYKTALRHFGKAVQFAPGNFDYLKALGGIYMIIEDYGSATKLYKELLTLPGAMSASPKERKAIEDNLAKAGKQWKIAQKTH